MSFSRYGLHKIICLLPIMIFALHYRPQKHKQVVYHELEVIQGVVEVVGVVGVVVRVVELTSLLHPQTKSGRAPHVGSQQ